jgi:hypothetical protein
VWCLMAAAMAGAMAAAGAMAGVVCDGIMTALACLLCSTIQEALAQIQAELTQEAAAAAAAAGGGNGSVEKVEKGLVDIFVSDLVPHREDELIEEVVRPMLSRSIGGNTGGGTTGGGGGGGGRLVRAGALIVLTFKAKATRGFSEQSCSDAAESKAAKLEADGLLQAGRTRVLHLMANRRRERTLVGFAA